MTKDNLKPSDWGLYLNKELSSLAFNDRVMDLCLDEHIPLLERLRYLSICSKNLDEFFEIRVGQLKEHIRENILSRKFDGLDQQEAYKLISEKAHQLVEREYNILNDVLLPGLEKEKLFFLKRQDWNEVQASWAKKFWRNEVQPIMTPIGLDFSHPFPRLINKSLNFIIELEGKDAFGRTSGLAIVQAPRSLPRFVRIPDNLCQVGDNFLLLSSIIHEHIHDLFPGMTVLGCYQFRLTRFSDMILDDQHMESYTKELEGMLHMRRYGRAVRLEASHNCPSELLEVLLKEFDLTPDDLYCVNGPVNVSRLLSLCDAVDRPELKFPHYTPKLPNYLTANESVLDVIKKQDVLLYHPYESFVPIIQFVQQASSDPNVVAIKQTLYRTGTRSEMVDALITAARAGKEVTAVIELRARFDEQENINVANRLQQAGALVVYGIMEFKTHAKMTLVIRREEDKFIRYVHLGTGNYHAGNAKHYTDYSLLTSNQEIGQDVYKVFMQLTGMGKAVKLKHLVHSPFTLEKKIIRLIEQEANTIQEGHAAHIIVKLNGLSEPKIIDALYAASQKGVKIDLIIRGICCLRPQIPGVSDNIRVISTLGRFLEHSRVYYFHNAGDPLVYCGSADWMKRNLYHRIEVCFPILDKKLALDIKRWGLTPFLSPAPLSWEMQSDGTYKSMDPKGNFLNATQTMLLQQFEFKDS